MRPEPRHGQQHGFGTVPTLPAENPNKDSVRLHQSPTRSAVVPTRTPFTVNYCLCGRCPSKLLSGKYPYVTKDSSPSRERPSNSLLCSCQSRNAFCSSMSASLLRSVL